MATYATWNPSDKHVDITLSDGDLKAAATTSQWRAVRGTVGLASGKWYYEVTYATSGNYGLVGVASAAVSLADRIGVSATGWGNQSNGFFMNNNATKTGVTHASTNVVMVAVDLDNGKIWWGLNGTWYGSGDPATGANPHYDNLSGTVYPAVNCYGSGTSYLANFGASAFTYSVPSGFNSGWFVDLNVTVECPATSQADTFVAPWFLPMLPPALSQVDTFLAPTTMPLMMPVVAQVDTFLVPKFMRSVTIPSAISQEDTFVPPEKLLYAFGVPALSQVDTLVAPIYSILLSIPAFSQADTIIAPEYSMAYRMPRLSLIDTMFAPSLSGVLYIPHVAEPNTRSGHITIKIQNNTLNDGLYLMHMNLNMLIKILQDSETFPDTTGKHISLKIQNAELGEDLILEYMALNMRRGRL